MKKHLTMDLDQAKHFLSLFNYTLITFQFLKNGKPAGHLVAEYPLKKEDWVQLVKSHEQGKEIFFMINEGDGEIYPGKSIPRSQQNVNRLTSLFIDTDDCPISEVKTFLKALSLKPHLVVETSPNKYHLYLLLDTSRSNYRNSPNFQKQRKNWKHCQHILSHLGEQNPKTDTTVKDSSRVFRLPGFYHLKNPKAPHLTRIKREYSHPHYNLGEITKLLDHHTRTHRGQDKETLTHHGASQYQLPSGKVGPGNRHGHLASLLGHVLNRELDPELARLLAYKVIEEKFENPKDFLPGGKRNHEIEDFIVYKLNDIRQTEEQEREKQLAIQIQDIKENEEGASSFELPDDFYFNAPGIVGEITKEISSKAYYPLPSFAFATAVTLLSLLKGKSVKAQDGTPPTNYFLALAPTGAGKNYAIETLQHTLYGLNKVNLMESKVRSDRGILKWLNRNDGVGCLYMDEAEELLKSLESDRSPQHIRNFKTMLLELYSSTNRPHLSFGEIASTREEPIVLSYPHFSSVIIGTPNILKSSFTAKSVTDGLFQRFNVVYSTKGRAWNENSTPAAALNGDIFTYLHDLARTTSLNLEGVGLQEGASTISIPKEVNALKDEATDHYNKLYNEELRQGNQLEGIYTRSVEKAMRLAVAITEGDTLQKENFLFALKFIENNTEAMLRLAHESFAQSEVSKEMNELRKFVAHEQVKNRQPVPYRDIIHGFRIRNSRELKILLDDCVEAEMIKIVSIKPTKKGGRPGSAYVVGRLD